MQLNFPSLVVGVAAAAVLLVSMSQTTPSSGPPRIEYGPNPRDMIQIKEGTPYTVPVGKLFVLTALGATQINGSSVPTLLRVNGQPELSASTSNNATGVVSICSVSSAPAGFTVAAGSTIDVNDQQDVVSYGRAWGYLANQ